MINKDIKIYTPLEIAIILIQFIIVPFCFFTPKYFEYATIINTIPWLFYLNRALYATPNIRNYNYLLLLFLNTIVDCTCLYIELKL